MVLKLITEYSLTVDNELTVLWEMNMQTEGSLTGRKCVAGCTTKRNTQCSVGHISCLNIPTTERREHIDLACRGSGNNRHYITRYRHR